MPATTSRMTRTQANPASILAFIESAPSQCPMRFICKASTARKSTVLQIEKRPSLCGGAPRPGRNRCQDPVHPAQHGLVLSEDEGQHAGLGSNRASGYSAVGLGHFYFNLRAGGKRPVAAERDPAARNI